MKKQNEVKNETNNEQTVTKPKREKKQNLFFLFADGKGFIHLNVEKGVGMVPNFADGELLYYTSRASANFAREFFLKMKAAEKISIFAKVG